MTTATSTVSVSLLGSKVVKINVGPAGTVREAVQVAAETLGVNVNPDQLGLIKNGEQVTGDATVETGDKVGAAGNVANG